jgi:ankyrin repeat protein
LANHAEVNAAEPDGGTALLWAARIDDLEIADLLIKAGADAKAKNRYGVSPLSLACTNGSAAMIEKLLTAGADPNAALPEGESPLMTAARTGKADAVQALIKHGANVNAKEEWRGQTALMWAAAEGHAEAVKVLLQAGADIHARSKILPLLRNPYETVPAKADTKPADGTPADPKPAAAAKAARAPRPTDFTPFLFAVRGGHIEVVKVLLAAGANPNEELADGTSALVLAAMNGRYELGLVLLDHDARPNSAGSGFTALHQVAWTRRPNIHKTPAAVPTGKLDSLAFAKALVAHGADVNARETKEPNDGNLGKLKRIGATPFLLAAKSSDAEFMRFLLTLGADPLLSTNEHITALEAAAGVGIYRTAESPGTVEEALECVKIAYESDKDVNHVDDIGRTAMHGAALRGANNVVQFLFDHGAKLDYVDKKGWTPLVIAEGVFYPDVFKSEEPTAVLLRKLGAKELDVPESVRYAGMDKDGKESPGGYDTTVGRGGGFEMPPPKPAVPTTPTTTQQPIP